MLIASFIVAPAPVAPRQMISRLIASRIGLTGSIIASVAPTMIISRASRAASVEPDTGASMTARSPASAASCRTCRGLSVPISIKWRAPRSAAKNPSAPRWTCSDARSSASMVITTSDCSTSSRGVAATTALVALASSSALSTLRFHSASSKPARAMSEAIVAPIRPRPATPTVVIPESCRALVDHLLGGVLRSDQHIEGVDTHDGRGSHLATVLAGALATAGFSSRWSRRRPNDEFGREHDGVRCRLDPIDPVDHEFGGETAQVVAGQADRGQRRVDLIGEWDVVVPDDRNVGRAGQTPFAEHLESTDRDGVVVREDPGGRLPVPFEQFVGQNDARLPI